MAFLRIKEQEEKKMGAVYYISTKSIALSSIVLKALIFTSKGELGPNHHLGIGIFKWYYKALSENQVSLTETILRVIGKNIKYIFFLGSTALRTTIQNGFH